MAPKIFTPGVDVAVESMSIALKLHTSVLLAVVVCVGAAPPVQYNTCPLAAAHVIAPATALGFTMTIEQLCPPYILERVTVVAPVP